jgi:hypothetical protein
MKVFGKDLTNWGGDPAKPKPFDEVWLYQPYLSQEQKDQQKKKYLYTKLVI